MSSRGYRSSPHALRPLPDVPVVAARSPAFAARISVEARWRHSLPRARAVRTRLPAVAPVRAFTGHVRATALRAGRPAGYRSMWQALAGRLGTDRCCRRWPAAYRSSLHAQRSLPHAYSERRNLATGRTSERHRHPPRCVDAGVHPGAKRRRRVQQVGKSARARLPAQPLRSPIGISRRRGVPRC